MQEYPQILACHLSLSDYEEWILRNTYGTLLDAGCGSGKLALTMAGRLPYAVGLDPSGDMVSMCNASAESIGITNAYFVRSTIEAFSASWAFDNITMVDVIEHFEDPLTCVEFAHRHLHSGGKFRSLTPEGYSCDGPNHLSHFSEDELVALIETRFVIDELEVFRYRDINGLDESKIGVIATRREDAY